MNEYEKQIGQEIGLKFYANFPIDELDKRQKALRQSRAVGRIIDTAYDRSDKIDKNSKALYFKNGVEAAKFMHALNHPKDNIIDLSLVSDEEIMAEAYRRMNKGLCEL